MTQTNGALQPRDTPPGQPLRLRTPAQVDLARNAARAASTTRPREALIHLHALLAVRPGDPDAVALLETALTAIGDPDPAGRAHALAEGATLDHPALRHAAQMIEARALIDADAALKRFLADHPDDPMAMRMLANVHELASRPQLAETLLRRALEIAPHFASVRDQLIDGLLKQRRMADALVELDSILATDPASTPHLKSKAAILKRLRRADEAAALYERLLEAEPEEVDLWADYASLLRGEGRTDEAIAAFRKAAALPGSGRAWWGLADFKTVTFDEADVAAMRTALLDDTLEIRDRIAIHFALARALDGLGRPAEAFAHLTEANAAQRAIQPFDIRRTEDQARRQVAVLRHSIPAVTPAAPADMIFIIGMPRSGSTLVDQILASHPQVEASEELPYLAAIANSLAEQGGPGGYPEGLMRLTEAQRTDLRARYLDHARSHRQLGRRLLIDKNPMNWQHLALIQAILPDAHIIDVRRHPLDCGFSIYRQMFGRVYDFGYALGSIGSFYRLYVDHMRHIETIQPGRVHRVTYEALVDDPETQVRALLSHLGLEFDEACLRFHETERPIYTASSEQVRRPLNRDGIGQWKPYEQWLGPLKAALGPVLGSYPQR